MNQYPFFHEPLSQPIESDAVEQLYLFQERAAIHHFDGDCTCAMAEALARGSKTCVEFLEACGHGGLRRPV